VVVGEGEAARCGDEVSGTVFAYITVACELFRSWIG